MGKSGKTVTQLLEKGSVGKKEEFGREEKHCLSRSVPGTCLAVTQKNQRSVLPFLSACEKVRNLTALSLAFQNVQRFPRKAEVLKSASNFLTQMKPCT